MEPSDKRTISGRCLFLHKGAGICPMKDKKNENRSSLFYLPTSDRKLPVDGTRGIARIAG